MNPFGFSNGWAELALKEPPPLVPSSLIASWLATGPPGMICVGAARPSCAGAAVEVLDRRPGYEHERDDERERQEDPRRSRG